jgi:DNA-binding transcriptional LysR family regulator
VHETPYLRRRPFRYRNTEPPMSFPDLNLLIALDALLAEGGVAAAARRLRLSPSAMSRTLSRLREATGDPLLVRAGRGLVPTPRAVALRAAVGDIVEAAQAALRPAQDLDPARLDCLFTLQTGDGFVENFGPALLARMAAQAPRARLRFAPKGDRDGAALRDGAVDLETGVVGKAMGPEVRVQALFHDRFIGVVRPGHPLCDGVISAARFAAGRHVLVSRAGATRGVIDDALNGLGLAREVAVVVGGFATALALVRGADLIVSVPERHTGNLRAGLFSFPLPFDAPQITVSMLWHPRRDADPAHRLLREWVRAVCADR